MVGDDGERSAVLPVVLQQRANVRHIVLHRLDAQGRDLAQTLAGFPSQLQIVVRRVQGPELVEQNARVSRKLAQLLTRSIAVERSYRPGLRQVSAGSQFSLLFTTVLFGFLWLLEFVAQIGSQVENSRQVHSQRLQFVRQCHRLASLILLRLRGLLLLDPLQRSFGMATRSLA